MTTTGPDPGAERIDIGDGITIPAEVGATAYTAGFVVEVTAAYDAGSGRYVARRVVVQAEGGQEVTGEVLRGITVAQMVRLATQNSFGRQLAEWPAELAKVGPTTETLQQVARIYRLALLLGDAPTNAVASALGVPRSTAGRWVTRARDRGFLTVIDPRAVRGES